MSEYPSALRAWEGQKEDEKGPRVLASKKSERKKESLENSSRFLDMTEG
jgi:hypothetical protein